MLCVRYVCERERESHQLLNSFVVTITINLTLAYIVQSIELSK